MELVVDTNIAAAAILRPGVTRNLVFSEELALYSPERLKEELAKHEMEFVFKSGLSRRQFRQATEIVMSHVTAVPHEEYGRLEQKAKAVSPDEDDWPLLALAMHKKCGLWSNDKKLKDQNKIAVYSTEELLKLLRPR